MLIIADAQIRFKQVLFCWSVPPKFLRSFFQIDFKKCLYFQLKFSCFVENSDFGNLNIRNSSFCNSVVTTSSIFVAFLIMWPGTIMWEEVIFALKLLSIKMSLSANILFFCASEVLEMLLHLKMQSEKVHCKEV